MRKIILIGAGGHAKSCIDVIKSTRKYKIIGILDKYKKGRFENIKILGNENYLNKIKKKTSISVSITVGQIKSYRLRENLFEKVKNLKFNLPKIVSKYSIMIANCHSPNSATATIMTANLGIKLNVIS